MTKPASRKKYLVIIAVALLGAYTNMHAANWFNVFFNLFSSQPTQQTTYAHSNVNNADMLSEQQAIEYVHNIIASIGHALRPSIPGYELDNLKHTILRIVRSSSHVYKWTAAGKRYKKDMIDQYINSAMLEDIEKRSYEYAYQQTNNQTIASRISESMRNNALADIQKYNTLNGQALAPYFGDRLKQSIRSAINHYDVPSQYDYSNYNSQPTPAYAPNDYTYPQPSAPPADPDDYAPTAPSSTIMNDPANYDTTLYPSDECAVCYDELSPANRIFMHPCGHDMCKTCAREWFFSTNKATCPHCRTNVDKTKLQREVYS